MASESSYENAREKSVKLRMKKYGECEVNKRINPHKCHTHYFPYECNCFKIEVEYDKHKSFVEAIKSCDIEVLMIHFKEGYDLSSLPRRMFFKPETPLYYAVESGHKEVVELLLQKGAKANLPKDTHVIQLCFSPIVESTRQNHTEITELLLQHGADPNVMECSFTGNKPLIYAIDHENVRMVELLLQYKTRLYNFNGPSPGSYGLRSKNLEIVALIKKYDTNHLFH